MEGASRAKNLTIRDYVATDRDACIAIFDSNVPVFFVPSERREFADFLDRSPGRYAVVEDERGAVIACGGIAASRSDPVGVDLTWGMVHGEMHGRGIGQFLTQERLSWIRQMPSISIVYLNTSHLTEAFYQKMGFRTVKTILNGYREGLHRCDMTWTSR